MYETLFSFWEDRWRELLVSNYYRDWILERRLEIMNEQKGKMKN